MNELEATKIDVFNPASSGPSNWTVKTAAIHRDSDFEDLPSEQRYAHQHLDKYRGQVLDQLDRSDRDEVNSRVSQWQAAVLRLRETADGSWSTRAVASVDVVAAQREVEALTTEHGLVFDPADGGSFTVAEQHAENELPE
ncbi:hypothetical protein C5B85_02615 [Pseudoclavibacter sp. AY1F1]|uniref:hypothetical protein n=1 Tax=Pseudoclavibacter sp. AY1F1 TaxID=2080583 RepID=UPI000CE92A98|nr:hypothetical protein [Pseudoclavibacter sp. AY1F1]PPF47183.1 hypothetical protein C5B85_02615 [Pseudoclavibacter sp. AY1F1]